MIKINRKIEYSLMTLKYLATAGRGRLVQAKEISDFFSTPFDVNARVLQKMTSANWLQSEQGAKGGYALIKDLNDLSLYDVYSVVLGPQALAKCVSGECELIDNCNISNPMNSLNKKFIEFYKSINVAEILNLNTNQYNLHEATL